MWRAVLEAAWRSSTAYTAWVAAAEATAARAAADAQLAEWFRAAHTASRGTYRVRRIHVELAEHRRAEGAEPVNHERIERASCTYKLRGIRL